MCKEVSYMNVNYATLRRCIGVAKEKLWEGGIDEACTTGLSCGKLCGCDCTVCVPFFCRDMDTCVVQADGN